METNFTVLSKFLKRILQEDKDVYVLFADGLEYYILKDFKKNCTKNIAQRVINVGISEQNAVSLAAGLAFGGKKPYLIMFGPFMVMRAAEQIKLDVCYSNANVKLIATNTGVSGTFSGGYSHCLVEDIAMLNAMPNVHIYTPSPDKNEIETILNHIYNHNGVDYIRLNCAHAPNEKRAHYDISLNKIAKTNNGQKAVFIATGYGVELAWEYANVIKEYFGYIPTIYSAFCLKPFDENTILEIIKQNKPIITIEEHAHGGLASLVAMVIAKYNKKVKFLPIYINTDNYNCVAISYDACQKIFLDKENFYLKYFNLLNSKKLIKTYINFNKNKECSIEFKLCNITILTKTKRNKIKKGKPKYKYYLFSIRVF